MVLTAECRVKLSARGLDPKPFTPEMKKQFTNTLVSLSQECKEAGQQPAVMATSENMLSKEELDDFIEFMKEENRKNREFELI